jgi:signal transduction histidine kinase
MFFNDIHLESDLSSLQLYDLSFENSRLGVELADVFDSDPRLPGVILTENQTFIGMISRRQFLEYLLLPQGLDLFLDNPLRVFFRYNHSDLLVLSAKTPILTALQRALKRSPQFASEPVIVCVAPDDYRVLDFGQLSLTAWQLRGIETQVRYERTQAQMIQSERMASLGRLVDGIAHEILDPVGFIWGNLTHIDRYSQDILQILAAYKAHITEPPVPLQALIEDLEIDYLQADFPRAVESVTTGAKRLRDLAMSLQNFCHVDDIYPKPADLHAVLDGILLLLKSRLSSEIVIQKSYCQLPPVTCYVGHLTQVLMNILITAVDSLLELAVTNQMRSPQPDGMDSPTDPPTIEILTAIQSQRDRPELKRPGRWVSIRIADNGPGMSADEQEKLRESFTIQRRAEKETSLSLSYQIITAKHGGEFLFTSTPGDRTEFEIILPFD